MVSICKYVFVDLEADGTITKWGLCVEDCPAEEPMPSCLNPPPIPSFGIFETEDDNVSGRFNYKSSWFLLNYLPGNESFYQITAEELERLHQPHWPYDETNLTDEIQFIVENNSEHFNAAYKIVAEGGEVNYTCSDGYVFQGTHNITQRAVCRNWTWDVMFNETKPCVRKETQC